MEHAQTGFYNQSNGGMANGGMLQKLKDTNSMTQYYSENVKENRQCSKDSKGVEPNFTNLTRSDSASRLVGPVVKYERESSFDSSCSQQLTQNGDCQLSHNKWVTDNVSRRNDSFSSDFVQLSKRPKYAERTYGDTSEDKQSCGLATKAENAC